MSDEPTEPDREPEDDEEARRARAARIREQARRLTSGQPETGPSPREPESARDFVERRSRELDEERKDGSSASSGAPPSSRATPG